ncbi:hypothetical protein MASR1M36_13150 [Candidatus Cloacimonadaceae bacterium]
MSWRQYRLGDILQKKRNVVRIEPENEYKLVTIRLHHKGITLRKIAKGSEIKSTMSVIRAGDFLLSGIDARNGAFGIVPSELDGAIITNDFWCLKPNEDVIDREYLLLLTETPEFDHICRISSEGVTQRIRLQKDKFFAYSVIIPPITEQKEIVRRIQEIKNQNNKLSVELNKQLDLVEKLRQAFLREAMQGKLVPQDPNDEPASELLKRIKAEKARLIKEKKLKPGKELPPIKPEEIPFPIPDNWAWCRLGQIGITNTGSTPSTLRKEFFGNYIPFIKPADITLQGIRYNNEGLSSLGISEGVLIEKNSILMVCIGGSIGKSFYNSIDVSCNQQINTISMLTEMSCVIIQHWLQSDYFQKELWRRASGGTTPIVNRTKWERVLIPIPPLLEQHRILCKLEVAMRLFDDLKIYIEQELSLCCRLVNQILGESLF